MQLRGRSFLLRGVRLGGVATGIFVAIACGSSGGDEPGGGVAFGGSSGASGASGNGGNAGASGNSGSAGNGILIDAAGGASGNAGSASGGTGNSAGTSASGGVGGASAAGGTSACTIDGGSNVGGSGGDTPRAESCGNGLDEDLDGFVDEGCVCSNGATQSCYAGRPSLAGIGACARGSQRCELSGEFGQWGPCTGSAAPAIEVCEGSQDEDCDGQVDENCACCTGETRPCGIAIGVCTQGTETCVGGSWGACTATPPGPEICNNGLDDDCDGQVDEGCVLDATVNLNGDCLEANCPPQAPYPIGCTIDMAGGDPRGCVANLGGGRVYFQEGDACGAGRVTGTLRCSSQPGPPLDQNNCAINKRDKFFPTSRNGCPDTN